MSLQFKPKTEKEIEELTALPNGEFPATVTAAESAVSKKSGADMIKITVLVYVGDRKFQFTDYLMPAMEVKLYNFCKQANLLDEYHAGSLTPEMCENKELWVKLGIQKGKDGFADKSEIKDYIAEPAKKTTPVSAKSTPTTLKPEPDDEAPF